MGRPQQTESALVLLTFRCSNGIARRSPRSFMLRRSRFVRPSMLAEREEEERSRGSMTMHRRPCFSRRWNERAPRPPATSMM